MVKAVLDPVPLIVLPEGTVAITFAAPPQPAANACVLKFKFDPVVRSNVKSGTPPTAARKKFLAANITVYTLVQQSRTSLYRQQ